MFVGYHPVVAPTCLRKQEVGKPSRNAAQLNAKAKGCVYDDLIKADKLRKGWRFRVGTWNIDSLTGRASEVVQTLADREVDMACVCKKHVRNWTRRMLWIMADGRRWQRLKWRCNWISYFRIIVNANIWCRIYEQGEMWHNDGYNINWLISFFRLVLIVAVFLSSTELCLRGTKERSVSVRACVHHTTVNTHAHSSFPIFFHTWQTCCPWECSDEFAYGWHLSAVHSCIHPKHRSGGGHYLFNSYCGCCLTN